LKYGLKNANTEQKKNTGKFSGSQFVNIIRDRYGKRDWVLELIKVPADHLRSFSSQVRYNIRRCRDCVSGQRASAR
jgi:hypothetical protein